MSKSIQNLHRIKNNPFALTDIIVEFYKVAEVKPKNLLLLYLILPIVLNKDSSKALQKKTLKRTIKSFKKENDRLFGLAERVEEYRSLSHHCLQFGIDQGELTVNDELSVIALEDLNKEEQKSLAKKAAQNLAYMFEGQDIVSIYRQLGIKRL